MIDALKRHQAETAALAARAVRLCWIRAFWGEL